MTKVRGNQPCPCGSGKKFKHCHGAGGASAYSGEQQLRAEFARIAMMRHEARQKEIEKQFGLGRPPISFESHGYKSVAVGSEVHWSPTWKTFPDFLMHYFKVVMGKEWGEARERAHTGSHANVMLG